MFHYGIMVCFVLFLVKSFFNWKKLMFSCSWELHIEYLKDNFTSDFSRRNELGTKERFCE